MRREKNRLYRGVLAAGALLIAASLSATPAAAADNGALPNVIAKATPAVVAIIGKPSGTGNKDWEQNRFNLGHGTGVIMQQDGVIVTNAHVVKDMKNLIVVTADGKSYSGKATNLDEESDLALVKIDATNLQPATLAASNDVKVGETVAAIGTPISFALRNSVTLGIVSGIDRSLSSQYQLIQTDAAINPGNSGGALVNMKGEVVGINTMKFASNGIESLGFAIPIDTVKYVLDHFQKYGKVKRPYLGLELEESWEAVVGLPSEGGLRVSYVEPESPAAKAGIKEGDLLLSIGGVKINTMVGYHEVLKKYLPNEQVGVTVQSGSASEEVKTITLGEDTSARSALSQDAAGSGLDADHGKTQIGDSHFGWSMKYPAGLVKEKMSSDGDSVNFQEAKGEFSLGVKVEDLSGSELSVSGLLGKLADNPSDTVLEKKYVKPEGGLPYAKLAAKSRASSYYQSRAYQQGGKLYVVTLQVHDEAAYRNKFKLNGYNDLMDSFKLSFDKGNAALKDISVFKSGGSKVTSEYGLTLELPAAWDSANNEEGNFFASQDYKHYVAFAVTSASSGDTLDAWLERNLQTLKDQYAEGYRQIGEAKESTLAGAPAKLIETSTTMGNKWESVTTILAIKDKYKYEIEIGYPKDGEGNAAFVQKMIDSIQLDKEAMNPALGFIQDVGELSEPDRTVKYHSEKFKYTFSVPETWHSFGNRYREEKDPDSVSYSFTGGSFSIRADAAGKLDSAIKDRETVHKKNAGNDAEYKYTVSDESVFDTAAKKFELAYSNDKVPYRTTEYVFEKNRIVYTVTLRINDAVRTDLNVKRVKDAFDSLTFSN